eukprot:TRINITY_DN663_c0_g1_i2.p1 TRINITY_DN663_c0_g1~~TRINITY_DN663_c0_g1_i2.p1  ORF type:complete len:1132 (-),score=246.29 TRINITY_DN663_c0_g1_i2:654-4049(-)
MGESVEGSVEQWLSESGRVWRCRDKGLSILPPALADIDTLQEIDASMNDLKFVNVSREGQWPALRKLMLNDNELSTLPQPIPHFSLLTHLELADNQVTQLGEEMGVLKGLEVLDLHGNRLTALPDALASLTHLRVLKLGFNQLSKAPAWLGMLPALEVLDLQSNRLTSLPVELSQLSSLKELYLSKNKLLKLPVEYHALTQLKVLQLDQNDLVDPPQYMAKLTPDHVLAYLRAVAEESVTGIDHFLEKNPAIQALVNASDSPRRPSVSGGTTPLNSGSLRGGSIPPPVAPRKATPPIPGAKKGFDNRLGRSASVAYTPQQLGRPGPSPAAPKLRARTPSVVGERPEAAAPAPVAGGAEPNGDDSNSHSTTTSLPSSRTPRESLSRALSKLLINNASLGRPKSEYGARNPIPFLAEADAPPESVAAQPAPSAASPVTPDSIVAQPGTDVSRPSRKSMTFMQAHRIFSEAEKAQQQQQQQSKSRPASPGPRNLPRSLSGNSDHQVVDSTQKRRSAGFTESPSVLPPKPEVVGVEKPIAVEPIVEQPEPAPVETVTSHVEVLVAPTTNASVVATLPEPKPDETNGHKDSVSPVAQPADPTPSDPIPTPTPVEDATVTEPVTEIEAPKPSDPVEVPSPDPAPADTVVPTDKPIDTAEGVVAPEKPPKRKKPKRTESHASSRKSASGSDVREPAIPEIEKISKKSKRNKKARQMDSDSDRSELDASSPADAVSEAETKDDWLIDAAKAKVKSLIEVPEEQSAAWSVESGTKLNFFDAYSPKSLSLVEGDSWDDYSRHFYQQEHFNFISFIKSTGEYLIVSVLKQPDATGYKVFIRSNNGDKRAVLPASGAAVWATAKDFKAALEKWPQVDNVLPSGISLSPVLDAMFTKQLLAFERKLVKTAIKVGVVYRKAGQVTENEILGNDEASDEFYNFMNCVADKVKLQGWDKYDGGLDTKDNKTGKESYHATYQGVEIMFHVSTLLPSAGNDPEEIQEKKKAHIGNDYVVIVFVEGDEPFSPHVLQSKFNHVFIIVRKVPTIKKKVVYQISVAHRASVSVTPPSVPADSLFERSVDLRSYMLAKVINSERTAIMSALSAQLKSIRTQLMKMLFDKYKSSGGCCASGGGKKKGDDDRLLFD